MMRCTAICPIYVSLKKDNGEVWPVRWDETYEVIFDSYIREVVNTPFSG
jgi:hypothetical protein